MRYLGLGLEGEGRIQVLPRAPDGTVSFGLPPCLPQFRSVPFCSLGVFVGDLHECGGRPGWNWLEHSSPTTPLARLECRYNTRERGTSCAGKLEGRNVYTAFPSGKQAVPLRECREAENIAWVDHGMAWVLRSLCTCALFII